MTADSKAACIRRGCDGRANVIQSSTRIRLGKNVREDVCECSAGHRFVVTVDERGFVTGTLDLPGPLTGQGANRP